MDWSGCDLVEVVEGKVSGVPLVKGTRIPADFVIESFEVAGSVEEVLQEYPRLSRDAVLQLVQFAEARHGASAA